MSCNRRSKHLNSNHKYLILPNRHILKVAGRLEESQRILDNNPAAGLAGAIAKAWEAYGSDRYKLSSSTEENLLFHLLCLRSIAWNYLW